MDMAPDAFLGEGGVRILAWAVNIGRCPNPSAMPVDLEATPPIEDSSFRVASSSKASHDTGFPSSNVSR